MSCNDVTKTASFTFYVTCLRDQNAPNEVHKTFKLCNVLQEKNRNQKDQCSKLRVSSHIPKCKHSVCCPRYVACSSRERTGESFYQSALWVSVSDERTCHISFPLTTFKSLTEVLFALFHIATTRQSDNHAPAGFEIKKERKSSKDDTKMSRTLLQCHKASPSSSIVAPSC